MSHRSRCGRSVGAMGAIGSVRVGGPLRSVETGRDGRSTVASRSVGARRAIGVRDRIRGIKDCPLPKASNVIPKIATRMSKLKHCRPAQVGLKKEIMDLNQNEGIINSVVVSEACRMMKKLALWNKNAAAWGRLVSERFLEGVNLRSSDDIHRAQVACRNAWKKIYDQNLKTEHSLIALEKQFLNKAEDKYAGNEEHCN